MCSSLFTRSADTLNYYIREIERFIDNYCHTEIGKRIALRYSNTKKEDLREIKAIYDDIFW